MKIFSTATKPDIGNPPRNGVVTVELAMILPIIFLFFFLSLELASINFARQTIGFAAYEAARKATIPGAAEGTGEAEAMRQMNLVGLGKDASINITFEGPSVTAEIILPSSGFSWGPMGFFGDYFIRESCTVSRE
jgi:hypothetical protein